MVVDVKEMHCIFPCVRQPPPPPSLMLSIQSRAHQHLVPSVGYGENRTCIKAMPGLGAGTLPTGIDDPGCLAPQFQQ